MCSKFTRSCVALAYVPTAAIMAGVARCCLSSLSDLNSVCGDVHQKWRNKHQNRPGEIPLTPREQSTHAVMRLVPKQSARYQCLQRRTASAASFLDFEYDLDTSFIALTSLADSVIP